MSDEILIKVEDVSKKFCRNLKKSLWYGMTDLSSEFLGRPTQKDKLRSEEFWAVKDVSFELKRGECIGLIGRNGAGKTTLLRMLNGLIKPDAGRIEMHGRVGALIALGAGFNPILTGQENIYVNASILGLRKKEIDEKYEQILEFAELGEFIDAPVQSYSSGMQVRLGFAVASAVEPDILLLDEVLAVGDASFQAKCLNVLADMRTRGVPFILVSHNMHSIARYCEKVAFMRQGRVEFIGPADEGIARYLTNNRAAGGDDDTIGPDWSAVHGSGRVIFTGARFKSMKGETLRSIKVGDSLCLEVEYECPNAPPENPVFDVCIRSHGEQLFQGTNKADNIEFGVLEKKGVFRLCLDSIPMNVEHLDFYFCLLDDKTGELFDWKRDLRLHVDPDAKQVGFVRLDTQWEVLPR